MGMNSQPGGTAATIKAAEPQAPRRVTWTDLLQAAAEPPGEPVAEPPGLDLEAFERELFGAVWDLIGLLHKAEDAGEIELAEELEEITQETHSVLYELHRRIRAESRQ